MDVKSLTSCLNNNNKNKFKNWKTMENRFPQTMKGGTVFFFFEKRELEEELELNFLMKKKL